MNIWLLISVLLMLAIAVILDLKTGKIPNKYNLLWVIYGLVTTFCACGTDSLLRAMMGGVIPLVGLMPLFAFGVIGAGDIKLLSAVGTFVGLNIFWVVIYSFLLCSIYGLVLIVVRLLGGVIKRGIRDGILGAIVRCRQCTRVAFSVFILGGFVWYLGKGGILLGI